jgi:hypothetical protein
MRFEIRFPISIAEVDEEGVRGEKRTTDLLLFVFGDTENSALRNLEKAMSHLAESWRQGHARMPPSD